MARRKADLKLEGGLSPGEDVPGWQTRSVERSLRGARLRAQERSDRFVTAALELIVEREASEFTIQDVVDRSGMSLRTFYTFFDGKDSLMLAIYETIMSKSAVPVLTERSGHGSDPVLRLKALIDAMLDITSDPAPLAHALSVFHLRLAETRPQDLALALAPLGRLITDLLTGVAQAGLLREDLDLRVLSALVQEMLLASARNTVLTGNRDVSAADMWAFCSAAILRRSEPLPGASPSADEPNAGLARGSTPHSRSATRSLSA
jgi:AcrR family transcriptional regulator